MVLYGYQALLCFAALAGSVIGTFVHPPGASHPISFHMELLSNSLPSPSGSIQIHTKKHFAPQTGKANATFIILARNSNEAGLLSSLQQNEEKFNKKYNYPYIILNDEMFTEEFRQVISNATRAQVKFGTIDQSMWGYPEWVDQEKAAKDRETLKAQSVPYASSESYRHMCRYRRQE
jgi:alpha 1,2-mannosyltransferase